MEVFEHRVIFPASKGSATRDGIALCRLESP